MTWPMKKECFPFVAEKYHNHRFLMERPQYLIGSNQHTSDIRMSYTTGVPAINQSSHHEAQEAAIELICGNLDIDTWKTFRRGVPDNNTCRDDENFTNGNDKYMNGGEISNNADEGIDKMHLFGQYGIPATSPQKNQSGLPSSGETKNGDNTNIPHLGTTSTSTTTSTTSSSTITPRLQQKKPRKPKAKTKSFEDRVIELKRFKAQHGHCNVPLKIPSLGPWCNYIRRSYAKRGKHTSKYRMFIDNPERIKILEDLGFKWTLIRRTTSTSASTSSSTIPCSSKQKKNPSKPKAKPKSFEERVIELKRFKAIHGHCNVPFKYSSLGQWCRDIRSSYTYAKRGKHTPKKYKLNPERIKILEDLGFQWSLIAHRLKNPSKPKAKPKSFEDRVMELKSFKELHGHCNVPRRYPSLGIWCNYMRNSYAAFTRKKGTATTSKTGTTGRTPKYFFKLNPERIKILEDLGFQWSVTNNKTFDERLADLIEFKKQHGHCNPAPKDHPSLYKWCSIMRRCYKDRLVVIKSTTCTSTSDSVSDSTYNKAITEEGGTSVVSNTTNGTTSSKRPPARKRRRSISLNQIRRLDEIGFQWNLICHLQGGEAWSLQFNT